MKIMDINGITKKDIPLYYRNDYEGVARISLVGGAEENLPLNFTVEMKPTGEKVVDLTLGGSVDYPLLPVIKALKAKILEMDSGGQLT